MWFMIKCGVYGIFKSLLQKKIFNLEFQFKKNLFDQPILLDACFGFCELVSPLIKMLWFDLHISIQMMIDGSGCHGI